MCMGTPLLQVIKVGTSSLIRADRNALNLSSLAGIVETARGALGFKKGGLSAMPKSKKC